MKKPIYSILDRVTKTYSQPYYAINDDDARRALSIAVNSSDSGNLFMHPDDFSLYRIGVFDDDQNNPEIITSELPISFICHASSLIANQKTTEAEK